MGETKKGDGEQEEWGKLRKEMGNRKNGGN